VLLPLAPWVMLQLGIARHQLPSSSAPLMRCSAASLEVSIRPEVQSDVMSDDVV